MAHRPTQPKTPIELRVQQLADQTTAIVARTKELEERGFFQLIEADYRLKRTPTELPLRVPDEP